MVSFRITFACVFLILLSACDNPSEERSNSQSAIATVFNKALYYSDMESLLPEGYKKEDSILIVNSYVENWVRDALLMHEAERKIPQNLGIDKLVKDYRSTLILHSYEKILIETEMDTIVSQEELQNFYNSNKEYYQLKEPLIRALFMKIPLKSPGLKFVDAWWKNAEEEDLLNLIEYNDKNGEVYMLNPKTWYKTSKIGRHLPESMKNAKIANAQAEFIREDAFYKYYLRILEVIQIDQAPPISYIEEKAKGLILQKRKNKLIENKKAKLYEENKNSSNVKIYTQ